MAVNPTTGINPLVDRFMLYRMSTSQIVNMNTAWPRTDGGPLVGANPDLRYFKRVTATRPDVDHRYTVTTEWTIHQIDPLPDASLPAGEYRESHEPVKLSNDELKAQIETEFQRQVAMQFPSSQNPALLLQAADVIVRKQSGATLTDAQQAVLDAITPIGDALTQLVARRDALLAAVDDNEDYDITEGWLVS
jgi:hypothetical protein